jgi:UDP-N-acetylmuramoyl-tripeptide--D-alanyl-D-alanine ligase
VAGLLSPQELGRQVRSVTDDSRRASHGDIFLAVKGERVDGHDYVADALRQGAQAAVVEEPVPGPLPANRHLLISSNPVESVQALAAYWREKHDVCVVGVTGSVGKTTVKEAIAQALTPLGPHRVLKSTGNRNTEITLPLELLNLKPDHKFAVLEMGMYQPGDIALLARIARPMVGVVTNVHANHLERTRSIRRTAKGKSELVHALPRDGLAVLNGEDPWVRAMSRASEAAVSLYGCSGQDFTAAGTRGLGRRGFESWVRHGSRRLRIRCPVPGVHNASNILPAVATAHHLGVPWSEIGEALAELRVDDRTRFLPGPNGSTLLDDRYNASAASTIAALALLKEEPGRHLALLGEMYELGQAEEEEHRAVGRHCGDLDALLLLGPRTRWIEEEARKAGLPDRNITSVTDNERAVERTRQMLSPGDVMLIKGSRGLELEDVVSALSELGDKTPA